MKRIELFTRGDAIGCCVLIAFTFAFGVGFGLTSHSWTVGLILFGLTVLGFSPMWRMLAGQYRKTLLLDVHEIALVDRGREVWRLKWAELDRIEDGKSLYELALVGLDGASHVIPCGSMTAATHFMIELHRPHKSKLRVPGPVKRWPRWLSWSVMGVGVVATSWGVYAFTAFTALIHRFDESGNTSLSQAISSQPLAWEGLAILFGIMAVLSGGCAYALSRQLPKVRPKTFDRLARPVSLLEHLGAGELSPWFSEQPRFTCGPKGRKYGQLSQKVAVTSALFASGVFGAVLVAAAALRNPSILVLDVGLGPPVIVLAFVALFATRRAINGSGWVVESDRAAYTALAPDGSRHPLVLKRTFGQPYLAGQAGPSRIVIDPELFHQDPATIPAVLAPRSLSD